MGHNGTYERPIKRFEREEQNMVTESSGIGASRNDVIFGSGLSGMVAAYIHARALEDNAASDDAWRAQSAFRPRGKPSRSKRAQLLRTLANPTNQEGAQHGLS